MASFEIVYDAEEDVLEVSFETFDEEFARTIPLNDNITLYTDGLMQRGWGLVFYSYAQLLEVHETELSELAQLSAENRAKVLTVIGRLPVSLFMEVRDVEGLIATVNAPSLNAILEA